MDTSTGLLTPPGTPPAPGTRGTQQTKVDRRWLAAAGPRLALAALLALTAAAYIYDLGASGYANSFYAAAVQAATKSWKAFFFGSLDSSNFITVDKPPASLWVMALSGRFFGFSSWSMLVPQALEGVAAVALLYAAVKRWFGNGAGLAAGAVLAATPVAALMFRFNNPDALLVALLVAAAYCLTRALERAGTRWVVAAGTMIGLAFLAKMLQAFVVLPGFALVYLIAAPAPLRRRVMQTLAGGVAVVVSAGWWVAIVALWPASSRPMIDGSPDNSILNLIFGYNGLGRVFGASGPGGGGGANFSGPAGLLRLFDAAMGGQASWLLPAALLALALGLVATRHAPRTDRTRTALLLWGGWLIVTGLVFSLSTGIIHTYYTVALAPAIAALVAIGGRMLWLRRTTAGAHVVAAVAVALTAGWAWTLLGRTPSWEPWLRTVILVAGVVAVAGLVATAARPGRLRWPAGLVLVAAAVAALAGPLAYAADTVTTPHTGSIPSAGPGRAGGFGGPGRGLRGPGAARAGGRFGGTGGSVPPGGASAAGSSQGSPPPGATAGSRSFPGAGGTGAPPSTRSGGFRGAPGGGGGPGAVNVSAALRRALEADSARYRWVAATSGSQSAASLELATGGDPVMAIGGFNNEGGRLSLTQFKQYVASGEIHYYIGSGGGPGAGGPAGSTSSAITAWVEQHFTAQTIGGQTVYDLTHPRG
ncbi:MAG TPA: glycosyltransferase family 39 protein [Solirubrobacteraceae bacterium]|nr:glycosyltransferase family 39 protein [Solirubrobacteraceae bacterium]